MDNSVLSYNTVLRGIGLDDLELHGSHASANEECVALSDRSVRFKEVRLDVHIENVATETLYGVVKR